MSTDDYVLSHDDRPITVGALVRHCHSPGGDVWQVYGIGYNDDDGRAYLSLVDPDDPHRFTAFYADVSVVVDDN